VFSIKFGSANLITLTCICHCVHKNMTCEPHVKCFLFIKPSLAVAKATLRVGAVHLFACRQNAYKNAIFSKSKQFGAMVSTPVGSPTCALSKNPLLDHSTILKFIISTKNLPILMIFGTQQHIWNSMTVTWPNMIFFKFKMAHGRHIENQPIADFSES